MDILCQQIHYERVNQPMLDVRYRSLLFAGILDGLVVAETLVCPGDEDSTNKPIGRYRPRPKSTISMYRIEPNRLS